MRGVVVCAVMSFVFLCSGCSCPPWAPREGVLNVPSWRTCPCGCRVVLADVACALSAASACRRGIASPSCVSYAAAEASRSAWRSASGRHVIGTVVMARRGRAVPPPRPAGSAPGPLLPQRGEGERLDEQHLTELPALDQNGRARIERAPQTLFRRLATVLGDTTRDLAHRAALRRSQLERLGSPTQGPADKDGPQQAPKMLIHFPR